MCDEYELIQLQMRLIHGELYVKSSVTRVGRLTCQKQQDAKLIVRCSTTSNGSFQRRLFASRSLLMKEHSPRIKRHEVAGNDAG